MHLLAYFCHIPKSLSLGPASSWPHVHPPSAREPAGPALGPVVPQPHSAHDKAICPRSVPPSWGGSHEAPDPLWQQDRLEWFREGHPAAPGLSAGSCWRKLPVEFGGCGELKPGASNVNKKCDQACQIFGQGDPAADGWQRSSCGLFSGWEGISRSHRNVSSQQDAVAGLATCLGVREGLGLGAAVEGGLVTLPSNSPLWITSHMQLKKQSSFKCERFDS